MLTDAERKYLLGVARSAIGDRLTLTSTPLPVRPAKSTMLRANQGAFVTLHLRGQLRGCIGYVQADRPLEEVVKDAAEAAAFSDPRFPPLRKDELSRISIEISVLSPPVRVSRPEEVQVGKHGIIISRGFSRGLLLPQVATEYAWDRETFLAQGCLKAGLPSNAYQKGATIEVFEAQVFGEGSA